MFGIKKKISDFEAMEIFFDELIKEVEHDYPLVLDILQRNRLMDYDTSKYDASAITDKIWTAGMFVLNIVAIYQSYEREVASVLYDRALVYLNGLINGEHQIDYICGLAGKFAKRYLDFEQLYESTHDSQMFPPVALLLIITSSISYGAYTEKPTEVFNNSPNFQVAFSEINQIASEAQNIWRDIKANHTIKLLK
ncbi:MAG: hypothetical protein WCI30_04675 [Clostridia bacterium]